MTPQPTDQVARAFARATSLTGTERDAFLVELRRENAAVADEVVKLLRQRDGIAEPEGSPGVVKPSSGDGLSVEDTTAAPSGSVVEGAAPKPTCDFLAPPQLADEIGRLGAYRVLHVLGQGGMGMVFKAEDSQLQRPVSLKVVKPAHLDEAGRQRFLREARSMAAVKHDHIVTIYQVSQQDGLPFLAMEFLQGESLEHWLQRGNQPTINQILRVGREIASGLAAAHQVGLIHRDIKPGNIWLEAPRGRVKILDFGLARAEADNTRLTRMGDVLGTPAYMAPEQAQGMPVDFRCDLFSLGCVLYRMCTGQAPFREKTVQETLIAVVSSQPPPSPQQRNPDIPKGLSDLVMKLLAKNPEDRPPSAQAVGNALKALQAERTAKSASRNSGPLALPKSQPIPMAAPVPKPSVATPWLIAGALAAVAALALIACLLSIAFWMRARPDPVEPKGPGDDKVVEKPVTPPPDPAPIKPKPPLEEPWIALFNGKDGAGLKIHPDAKLRRGWKVENGLLIAEQVATKKKKGTPSNLFSESGDFDDFHLRLEAKYSDGAKMLLYFRSTYDNFKPKARSLYIGSAPLAPGRLVGMEAVKDLTKPDEWFTLDLIVEGQTIRVKVNDETIVNTEEAVYPQQKGHFVLSATTGADFVVAFRKIEVKHLRPRKAP